MLNVDLSTVTTANTRQTIYDSYTAPDHQTMMQAKVTEQIACWCNYDWASPTTSDHLFQMTTLQLQIDDTIDSDVLDQWEGDLTGRGYTITRGNVLIDDIWTGNAFFQIEM
jgi:hypothetical protein